MEALATAVRLAVAAGELDRALVGLAAGVGEEHAAPTPQQLVETGRERRLRLVVVEVRDVQERARLRRERIGHDRVGVTE